MTVARHGITTAVNLTWKSARPGGAAVASERRGSAGFAARVRVASGWKLEVLNVLALQRDPGLKASESRVLTNQ